nr:beta-ketoacyl-[acyl-carrier-protein] synthase family protein [uncultured Desulfobulbus sp.]
MQFSEAQRAVIVGYDAISPLGGDLEEQWSNAIAGRSGVGPLTRFPLRENFPVRIAGELPEIDHLDYPFLTARHQAAWHSPIFKYGMLTVARALEHSGIHIDADLAPRVAITYSSAVGGVDAVLTADRRLQAEGKLPHPYANPNSCINMIGGKISMLTGAQGPILSTITACATGLSSMLVGSMLLAQGRADVALCGAVDCSLVEPILAGFHTMNGAYFPKKGEENDPPESVSRPFSQHRRGFVVSEGAGAVILTTKEFAAAHGLHPRAELAGWGMTSDAHHFVMPAEATVRQCMLQALADAGVAPTDIAAVNAHATSTKAGDQVEFDALHKVFAGALPPVSANKSQLGHAMGASSVIETILTLRGMEENLILPTINYQPDPQMELDCVAQGTRSLVQEHVLKNAFGFGGCNACAVLKKID